MDRNREARRATMATANGSQRQRHRTNRLRDSPEDGGALELQHTARLRDRTSKKDRNRKIDRSDRDRVRHRSERDRDWSSRSKRRRGEKCIHVSNREDGGDYSSKESENDDDEEDLEDGSVRFVQPNPMCISSSSSPSSTLIHHRKSYPQPAEVFPAAPTWKAAVEMIGFSIPKKARSGSTKRSHECWSSRLITGEQILRQASSSPVRPNLGALSMVASPPPAPMSPSSSYLSLKKKIKANGAKQRAPESSAKPSSSLQDDIEIEVAEVLFGLMKQSYGPSKQQEMMLNDSSKFDPRDVNRSTGDSKSSLCSPIPNTGPVQAQNASSVAQNSSSSVPLLSHLVPKRKRPRPASQLEENPTDFASRSSPASVGLKTEPDLLAKQEVPSPYPEKNSGSATETGGVPFDMAKTHGPSPASETRPEPGKPLTGSKSSEAKPSSVADQSEGIDMVVTAKVEEAPSPRKESVDDRVESTATQQETMTSSSEKEDSREEKLEIDLMAPPRSRSSPECEKDMDYRHPHESMVTDGEVEPKANTSEDEKAISVEDCELNSVVEEKKAKSSVEAGVEGAEVHTVILNKARNVDLHLDLERVDRSGASSNADDNGLNQQSVKQSPSKPISDDASTTKAAQSDSFPLPVAVPAGLPPMGYMAPLQGVMSMDGRTMTPTAIQPPHFLFTQPRPRRCSTHCYIAKNIQSHQQFMKTYLFWPAAAGAAPLFGAMPNNVNAVPLANSHGNAAGSSVVNNVQDKAHGRVFFPGQQSVGKDKSGQPVSNVVDSAQKKQFFQGLPLGGRSSIIGPTTLYLPLSQQQVAAAGAPANSTEPFVRASTAATTSSPTSTFNTSVTGGQGSPASMSFNYPNMAGKETQYLVVLGNGAYQFPIPTNIGAAQAYSGAHAQVLPFFNGLYYPSQMLHPSQLLQQQQATPQSMQIHQNPSISAASSSSQKHLQSRQQGPKGITVNAGTTNAALQTFPSLKSQVSHKQQHELGCEESPSTADGRVPKLPNTSVYGQNLTLPFNGSNFPLLTSASFSGATITCAANGNHSDKKRQQPQTQQQTLKAGIESLAPQAFAVPFASIDGTTNPGFDIRSIAQNHAFLQTFPDAARHNCRMMAAAAAVQAAQQKKNSCGSEGGKSGSLDTSNMDKERKVMVARASASVGQSIALSRSDLVQSSVVTPEGSNVVDSSSRSLNLAPGVGQSSRSSMSHVTTRPSASSSQQQHQSIQPQKQQQLAAASRNKPPVTGNGTVYIDQLASASAMAAKFPNAPQPQGKPQQGYAQISFGGTPKSSVASQGRQRPSITQSPSPPLIFSSSTSSVPKGASGSLRMNKSPSTGDNPAQSSSSSNQQSKHSPSGPNQKSSAMTGYGWNMVHGSPHIPASSSMGSRKPQLQQQSHQQLQQPQLSKQSIQQTEFFFSTPYLQTHSITSAAAASAAGGFQLQRHKSEQQQPSKSQGTPASTSSTGMLLCPTIANASTTDPAKLPQPQQVT